MQDKAESIRGVDGVAGHEVCEPWCGNKLLPGVGWSCVETGGLLGGADDGVWPDHGKD